MDNRDPYFPSGRSASRPPARENGEDPGLFTEITLDQLRRTPNSGRPVDRSAPPPARDDRPRRASSGGAHVRTGPSRRSPAQDAPQRPREPVFTELSWDDFRSGNFDPPAAPPEEPAVPPVPDDPFGMGRDYRQYAQPVQRRGAPGYNNTTRTAPAHRGYDPNAYQRDPTRPGTAPRSYTPPPRQSGPSGGYGGYSGPSGGSTPPRRPRKRGLHPIFYVIALVLVILVVAGIRAAVRGISSHANTPKTTPVQYVPGSAVTPAPVTPSPDPNAPETTPEITPTPSPEPSPTPAGPKAQRSGQLIVPADWGPAVPQRYHTQYDSYFDKSCMIGNSLVEGFFMWSGMTNIRYIYNTGAVVSNVIGVMDLGPIALNPGYYTDIYLMFGLNEVGADVNTFVTGYKKLVDFIRDYQPSANIYCISVTPVTEKTDKDPNEAQSMERIDRFNEALRQFCVDNGCWYLDIYSMLLDDQGYLSAEYAFAEDGKHFEKSGYVAWANYMKTHYVDEGLLTER